MMAICLIKGNNVDTVVNLHYAGDAVVLEATTSGIKSHYFQTYSESIEFIIKQSYALLSLGYNVYEDVENERD